MISSFLILNQKTSKNNLLFHEHPIQKSKKRTKESRSLMDEIFIKKPHPIYPIVSVPKFYTFDEHNKKNKVPVLDEKNGIPI